MCDHVRRFEVKRHARKLAWERTSQLLDIFVGFGMMFLVKRDENLSVERSDVGCKTEGEIECVLSHADDVEDQVELVGRETMTNLFLHPADLHAGLFDTSSRHKSHMQPE